MATLSRHATAIASFVSGRLSFLRRHSSLQGLMILGSGILVGAAALAISSRDQAAKVGSESARSLKGSSENAITSPVLRPYPSIQAVPGPELAMVRNPFAAPSGLALAKVMPAPMVSIKGFSGSGDSQSYVFMSINNSADYQYRLGQEVGNGYRITSINTSSQTITISDGISRFNYVLEAL